MLKNKTDFWGLSSLKSLKVMITVALFSAISFLFGKFLAIPVGDYMRFSFENLPIILAGVIFGPTVGAFTGLVADIVGCILRGYAINPILTLASVLIGFLAGAIYYIFRRLNPHIRLLLTVLLCHSTGSVIIKTIGLCFWYGSPFYVTLISRIINYLIVAAAEFVILDILLSNKSLRKTLNK